MFTPETENNDSFQLSRLDQNRLEDMEIGDLMDGELGDFRVLRYKDVYMLFVFNESLLRKTQTTHKEFASLKDLISFLQ